MEKITDYLERLSVRERYMVVFTTIVVVVAAVGSALWYMHAAAEKQQNRVNGEAIQLSLAGLSRLQQLMAEARGHGAVTYDDKGRTSPSLGGGRSFEV